MSSITRRRALGAAAAGLGAPVLAACGDDGAETTAGDPTSGPASPTSAASPTASSTPTTTATAPAGDGIPVTDVPVGGGLVVADAEVVVTQPAEGEFRAFSALCTHQGCLVGRVADGEIQCPCHGSRFSITDGAPTSGPASAPLEAVEVTVRGDRVVLG